ncbi:hypothetical protein STVA_38880 [Allostella vacuolata]|nr:hypothetical protein STVA_38880 [Stella vacuolata]
MRTEDLIRALAADRPRAVPPLPRLLAAALLAGLVVAVAGFLVELGVRADIREAAGTIRFLVKPATMLLLAASALATLPALARPGGRAGPGLLLAPLALAAAVAVELAVTPSGAWGGRLVGSNALVCLVAVPLLALPLLLALLGALRQGAPERPGRLGALAGTLAGALAAALYAIHCPDDSPLFVAAWYSLAIAVTTLAGAAAGRRLLRW